MTDAELDKLLLSGKSKVSDADLDALLLGRTPGSKPKLLDERHPDISFKDRLIAKNLGNDAQAQVAYLAQQYPGHDVKLEDGKVAFKRKDEADFKRLDPSGFDLEDITDIGYDILSGIGESAATAGAGIAGAAGGGITAVPAAMAAGSASSALSEYLRQKLGQAAGIPQDIDTESISLAGKFGAVSPLLFGTGAVGKQFARKGLQEGTEAFTKAMKSQKGVLSRMTSGTGKAMTGMAEKLSNVERQAYVDFANNPKTMAYINKAGADEYAEQTLRGLFDKIEARRKDLGRQFDEKLVKSEAQINLGDIRSNLDDQIAVLENKLVDAETGISANEVEKLNKLRKMKRDIFERKIVTEGEDGAAKFVYQDMGDEVSASMVPDVRDTLKNYTDFASHPEATRIDKQLQGLAEKLNARVTEAAEEVIPDIRQVNLEYRDTMKDMGWLREKLMNKKKLNPAYEARAFDEKGLQAMKTFHGTGRGKDAFRRRIEQLDTQYGTNVAKRSNLLRSHSLLQNAPWRPISAGGTTSTSATINAAMVGGGLGYLAGAKLNEEGAPFGSARAGAVLGSVLAALGASPAAMKKLVQAGKLKDKTVKNIVEKYPSTTIPYRQQQSIWNLILNEDK